MLTEGSLSKEEAGMSVNSFDRRQFGAAVAAALESLTFGATERALAQTSRGNYFNFNLAGKHPTGYGVDPSVSPTIYKAAATHLSSLLVDSRGVLSYEGKKGTYELRLKANDEREAIDFARTVTRDIWRERHIHKASLSAEPSFDEVKASIQHVMAVRSRYKHVPVGMSVYACDNERGGSSFGTPAELAFWNKASNYHGIGNLRGPIREQGKFLDLVRSTTPGRTKGGDLLFVCGFNGHGAPGGDGMSMLSNGASSLSRSLMSGVSIAKALEEHCHTHRDLYMKQAKSENSAYIGVFIFCCYSQDQMRNNTQGRASGKGNDVLSRLESLTTEYKTRFYVFTESETMKPGYYQPGTKIPSLGPRALARETDRKGGNLEIGDIYPSIGAGGEGVGSNPSLFVTDWRRPFMFQIV